MKPLRRCAGHPRAAHGPISRSGHLSKRDLADGYKEDGHRAGRALESLDPGLGSLAKSEVLIQRRLIERFPADEAVNRKKLADMINVQGWVYFKQREFPRSPSRIPGGAGRLPIPARWHHDGSPAGPAPLPAGQWPLQHRGRRVRGRPPREAALEAYEQSLKFRSALVDAHPSVTDYQEKLGVSLGDIAPLQHATGQAAEGGTASSRQIESRSWRSWSWPS